jgi:hypothetical protein
MTIKVQVKNVYGNERIYPVDHIQELEALTGTKTLSRGHVRALRVLGCEVVVVQPELV